ncbi:MAG: MBL fold metallo-hydrolase [Gammaproteobacteria bacterium]|nr:MBL fold metallo-hydrolase [Gammaproteobacteria bacterium]
MSLTRRNMMVRTAGASAGLMLAGIGPRRAVAQAVGSVSMAGDIHLLQSGGVNVLAIGGADGITLLDGGPTEQADALLAEVARLFPGHQVRTLFNTHWHPEQTGCNERLGAQGARIIAHENTRLWLTTDIERPWEQQRFAPMAKAGQPNQTFYDAGEFSAGATAVQYGYLLQAHTDGDAYAFLPEENILFTGGAVTSDRWPLVDWWTGGWIGGLAAGQKQLLEIANEQTRIVPSSGPVITRAELAAQQEMYAALFGQLRQMMFKGRAPADAVAAAPTRDMKPEWGDATAFVSRAFESLWGQLSPDA